MAGIPPTRYVRSGDADIAYQVFGSGEDMVAIPGFTSHLEVMWELPEFAAFLDRLGSFRRVIIFDKRGTGMSDRMTRVPAVEQHVQDILAVMDAAGSARASVAGWADGAFLAAMLAATHPDRVSALVIGGLWVTSPGGKAALAADPVVLKTLSGQVEAGWRQGLVAQVLAPSYADDAQFRSWWRRWEAYSASPRDAAALLGWAARVDLAPVLPAIQAPTLVLGRSGTFHDQAPNRAAAAQIPGARYVALPGADALPYLGDADAMLDQIQEFLTGTCCGTADPDRYLTTVLFTDIAGSTQQAGRLGDRRWQYLLRDHHTRVRRALSRYRGTEVDTAGDGFFATFDGPARAIRCACAIRDSLLEIGIEIRAGLHTGEVERHDTSVSGLAVHVGARVAALAGTGEVLVTSTVQMLVLGSGIAFADRGEHTLKGVPGQWRLSAVTDP